MDIINMKNHVVAVIGLGYVGLPLAVEFGKKRKTIGFDINAKRISELVNGVDNTLEVESELLAAASGLIFTNDIEALRQANIYIVTVPTPIDDFKKPDLTPLIAASEMLARVICKGDIVIYESTVYPGATEDDCVPVLEEKSGMVFNQDFYAGYSPERINPGDKARRVTSILKVTSGSTPEVAEVVDALYKEIITAGTYKASSIKVAEASKAIENTQRDVNIALINEIALICNKIGIDTHDVLEAAGTKWNFLKFKPGLVGGHCIGVDPYYLAHKAESEGYHPQIILAGRRINDDMSKHVVSELVKAMLKKRIHVDDSNVLILGLTFKENCPDIRNTKIVDVIKEMKSYSINVDVYDPWVARESALDAYGIRLVESPKSDHYDAVLLAVAHDEFIRLNQADFQRMTKNISVVYDLKCVLPKEVVDLRL